MHKHFQMFVPITKVDAATRTIYGVGALEVPDKTGETFHYESSKPYIQSWSDEAFERSDGKSYGNIREMHGKTAVGKLFQPVGFNDEQRQVELACKVGDLDDVTWNKVEEGILTGFSVGGDYVQRWQDGNTKYYTAKPSEWSLVDNPAMPGAHFTMVKADGLEETRPFATYAPGDEPMRFASVKDISNDIVVARAMQIAKDVGATGFSDFIASARLELEKSADDYIPTPEGGNPGGPGVGLPGVKVVKPDAAATITDHSGGVPNNADTTKSGAMAEITQENSDSSEGKGAKPGNTATPDLRGGSSTETHPDLGKTNDPRNEVVQGWRAKDNSFHLTKADALKHNTSLSSPAAALDAALQDLGKAVKGDGDGKDGEGKDDTEKAKAPTFLADKDGDKGAEKATNGDKPYGDVEYADPGYQSDKKKRYPLSSTKKIKAAWSYINMPKNQKKYTSAQVSSIKSKIEAAWKAKIDKDGPPSAAEKLLKFRASMLQKGMYNVARLAGLIEELDWLHQSLEQEAEWEKDDSPIPEQLKGDLASLVGTLKNLVDEETSEMFDDEEHIVLVDLLEMAATGLPGRLLNKLIATVEGSTKLEKSISSSVLPLLKAKMPKEHVAKVQEIHDHSCEMGAKCDMGTMGKAAGGMVDAGTLAKGMEVLSQENAELRTQNDNMAESLNKAVATITDMAADIRAIKEQPVATPPTKLQVVEKGGATGSLGDGQAAELLKHVDANTLATAAIGLIHRTGGVPVRFNR